VGGSRRSRLLSSLFFALTPFVILCTDEVEDLFEYPGEAGYGLLCLLLAECLHIPFGVRDCKRDLYQSINQSHVLEPGKDAQLSVIVLTAGLGI
jgi:hypothetical protein